MLTSHCSELWCNDVEAYAANAATCFIKPLSVEAQKEVKRHIEAINSSDAQTEGVVCQLYSPRVTDSIQPNERAFFTRENALRIDSARAYIEAHVARELQPYCLTPLMVKMTTHSNTFGHFKGFLRKNGVGMWSKATEKPLLMKPVLLETPVFNPHDVLVHVTNMDALLCVAQLPDDLDVIYLDPPYDSCSYSTMYHLLNTVTNNLVPREVSDIGGVPKDKYSSPFCSKKSCREALKSLLHACVCKSTTTILSYSTKGLISQHDLETDILSPYAWTLETRSRKRGGGYNNADKSVKVTELLYVIKALSGAAC